MSNGLDFSRATYQDCLTAQCESLGPYHSSHPSRRTVYHFGQRIWAWDIAWGHLKEKRYIPSPTIIARHINRVLQSQAQRDPREMFIMMTSNQLSCTCSLSTKGISNHICIAVFSRSRSSNAIHGYRYFQYLASVHLLESARPSHFSQQRRSPGNAAPWSCHSGRGTACPRGRIRKVSRPRYRFQN